MCSAWLNVHPLRVFFFPIEFVAVSNGCWPGGLSGVIEMCSFGSLLDLQLEFS